MSAAERLVEELTDLVGVARHYTDQHGNRVENTAEARRAVLAGLGLPTGTDEEARASIARVAAIRRGMVPAIVLGEVNRPIAVALRGVAKGTASWRLVDEAGDVREGHGSLAAAGEGATLHLPALGIGYHRLIVEAGGQSGEGTVIAAPARCWQPAELSGDGRLWGTTAQAYGLRSPRNLGLGDYTDIADAAEGSGALGASFLGLSPLHALFPGDRGKISPYSPSSRLFLETGHIDPAAVSGFEDGEAVRLMTAPDFERRAAALRDGLLIDHAGVWTLKVPVLDALWQARTPLDNAGLAAFRAERGEALELHATFDALSEHLATLGHAWLGDWPAEYRDHRSPEVEAFRTEHADRIAFHAWLQYIADLQLEEAARRAADAGMSIGLYRDLAVGPDRGGSELWAAPHRFADLSVGAPPDPLGPLGQNWGLPPFDPLVLEQEGLAAFRDLVTANMRHAGAIRIDHAYQLQRLFLIPQGGQGADGAYVDYPFEALLAVLRLESHRHRCMVIAEDLGTGPENFSERIMQSGVLSYRVLFFERGEGGSFKPPRDYPRSALSVFTTHDLPTFRGWWRGLDVDLRETLGIYDRDTAARERSGRREEIRRFCEALAEEGILPSADIPEEPPLDACMRYLARTPCELMAVQLEDVAGELNQANLPGPDVGHPNWRRRLSQDIEDLTAQGSELAKISAVMASEGRGARARTGGLALAPPRATYRLQFHAGFTFDHAVKIVPYLARLGVSHVYASPLQQARPGSTHGYDIVNHGAINPELGGEEGFIRLSDALAEHDLGLILDIVPNHMGVGGADNAAWLSVLEWGELSPEAKTFDVDWQRLGANGKLVVPFLGDRYGDALDKGDLELKFDAATGSLAVWHYEHLLPVCPLDYPEVLDRALAAIGDEGSADARSELLAVSERLRTMREDQAPERRAAFAEEGEALKARIASAAATPDVADAIGRAVVLVNGTPGNPDSMGTLHRLLENQSYRLAHWRVAASDINYRRFFDINALGGLRVEEPSVFERAHELIFRLVREGRIQGLRIDHIDGLADPGGYAHALQTAIGPGFYVVVEKILEPGEPLRPWPIAGTTGYDVLNLIDGIFVDQKNAQAFTELYREVGELGAGYGTLLRQAKAEIIETSFASELEVLVSDAKRIADADRHTRDYTVIALRRAIADIVARFPVYRTYIGTADAEPEDRKLLEETVRLAKRWSVLPDRSVHDFVHAILLGENAGGHDGEPMREDVLRFRRRFQQLTGPVMAKSLEDTLFYRYARLLALNEVGGDPDHFGGSVEDFHRLNQERAEAWPHAMIATATHDTKRGEDARARLLALSEIPAEWKNAQAQWREVAASALTQIDGVAAPDGNDQYILFQALLGVWPIEILDADDAGVLAGLRERVEGFATKALREAKRHSSWVNADEEYEAAMHRLIGALLEPGSAFLETFRPLAQRLARAGALNALSRTVLKATLPGVPDTYQGTEFWDFSLVDPDNRRPVDYAERDRALDRDGDPVGLLANWRDGRIKQFVLHRLLEDRAAHPALYAEADYEPLDVEGEGAGNVLAFARVFGEERRVVIIPRLVSGTFAGEALAPAGWGDTRITLPPGKWRDVFTGSLVDARSGETGIGDLLRVLPFTVLGTIS